MASEDKPAVPRSVDDVEAISTTSSFVTARDTRMATSINSMATSQHNTDALQDTAIFPAPAESPTNAEGVVPVANGPHLSPSTTTSAPQLHSYPFPNQEGDAVSDGQQEEEEEDASTMSPSPSTSPMRQYLLPVELSGELGASLFSVPPADVPGTGIYTLPLEAFEMRDLDSGRTFYLDKRYWIKDVDTGHVYVMQPSEASAGGSGATSAKGATAPVPLERDATANVRVSDLLSGEELSLREFELALGYARDYRHEQQQQQQQQQQQRHGASSRLSSVSSPSRPTPAELASSVASAAQRGISSLGHVAHVGASWVRSKTAAAIDRVASSQGGRGVGGAAAGSLSRGSAGGASASPPRGSPRYYGGGSLPSDGHGLPVKVSVTRKPFRELTDLRLVQRVAGHQGVIWAAKFSRSGKYLATAGQDCVVAVWEVNTQRRGSGGFGADSGVAEGVAASSNTDDDHGGGAGGHAASEGAAASGTSTIISEGQQQQQQQRLSHVRAPSGGGQSAAPPQTEGPSTTYGVGVLHPHPVRMYRGHKADILEVSWSKTNFLLSASMDRTVRLWHASVEECLRVFKHSDFVTAIDFHPADDKLFVSGSIDGRVRLWNVPEQRVIEWQDVHDMVTAVGLSKDGRRTVVGTMRGKCRFYGATSGAALDYEAQLDVKNKRGQHARGKKVTGVTFAPKYTPTSTVASGNLPSGGTGTSSRGLPPLSAHAGGPGAAPASSAPGRSRSPTRNTQTSQSLLVTSNDSRIRLYDGYVLRAKFKGHANRSTQIKASFSPRGDYIICGSDDGWVYIWTTRRTAVPGSPERGLQAGGGGRETHAFDGAASRGTDANGNAVNSGIYSNNTNINKNTIHSSQSDTPRSPLVVDTGSARSSSSAAGTGVPVSQPVAKEKNSSFECFQVASDVVTVALFAPECAQRALESFSPTSDAAAAAGGGGNDVGGRLLGHGGLRGQVILTAGYNGEIKIYENIGLPHWL